MSLHTLCSFILLILALHFFVTNAEWGGKAFEPRPENIVFPLVPPQRRLDYNGRTQPFLNQILQRSHLRARRSLGYSGRSSVLEDSTQQGASCGFLFSGNSKTSQAAAIVGEVLNDLSRVESLSFLGLPLPECTRKSIGAGECEKYVEYRRADGLCNNMLYPSRGSAGEPLRRMMPADYDGLQSPKTTGLSGLPLPSSRSVSLLTRLAPVGNRYENPSGQFSTFLPIYAHFVQSDLVELTESTGPQGCLDCCSGATSQDSNCFPISVPSNDPKFTYIKCLNYVRLLPGVPSGCNITERTPVNLATPFHDASHIYGSSIEKTSELRRRKGGRLKVTLLEGQDFPPVKIDCSSEGPCFNLGSSSSTLLPETTAFHTIWIREHNRIAAQLELLNPHWSDNKLFEETRKILTAEMQHITINEFLPAILGEGQTNRFHLKASFGGFFGGYNPQLDPQVMTGYAGAAALFYHSMWHSSLILEKDGTVLRTKFFDVKTLFGALTRDFDGLLQTLTHRNANIVGYFSSATTEGFSAHSSSQWNDLFAILIQMGRDMGLPKYVQWRKYCGLSPVSSFEDLAHFVSRERIVQLQRAYRNLDDVELLPGGLAEKSSSGGLLGETLTCIVTTQWQHLRSGDRFWYDNYMQPTAFSQDQLSEIRKANLARILCDNADLKTVQPNLLFVQDAHLLQRPNKYSVDIRNRASVLLEATNIIATSRHFFPTAPMKSMNRNQLAEMLPAVDMSSMSPQPPGGSEMRPVPCDHTAKYRTVSGWCNNIRFPEHGSSFRPFVRLVPPTYDDVFSAPRARSIAGGFLPSPRTVSVRTMFEREASDTYFTHLTMQWGQFLDHDLTFTPVNTAEDGEPLDCTSCSSRETVSENCFPILVEPGDPFFPTSTGGRCLNFVRSSLGQLRLGVREQLNELTAYLDGSNVYGSDMQTANSVRTFAQGRLKVQKSSDGDLPPANEDDEECKSQTNHCFFAGDKRSNEHIGLTSMHNLWIREHNRVASQFLSLNPHWNDEKVYQETRKLIGAMMQHITFSEFLPRILGLKVMEKYGLLLEKADYYQDYDESCDATISNVFATSAYRFGHTLIQGTLNMQSATAAQPERNVSLVDKFFDPSDLYTPGTMDSLLVGFCHQSMQKFDSRFAEVVRNHLFEDKRVAHSGTDLPALNIQRGRDHGLGSYLEYRRWAKLRVPRNFDDLYPDIMTKENAQRFKATYKRVEDIDAFPGMMAEIPQFGSVVGPTVANVLGEQFSRLRRCDRFWYENGQFPSKFTKAQLEEIRKLSLSSVFCSNLQTVRRIQKHVFNIPDEFSNKPILCEHIPKMDLSYWQEVRYCDIDSVKVDVGHSKHISPCLSCTCTTDGPLCQSIRVSNCLELGKRNAMSAIRRDQSCLAQCSPFLL